MGWGIAPGNAQQNQRLIDAVVGKPLNELFNVGVGILDGVPQRFDFALHDLAGISLDQPVYKLLGTKGKKANTVYSGMIYLDELEPVDNPAGFDKVIENCQWDIDYGYRQLKVKIGRSGRWYPHDEGLRADIAIVNRIHEMFADQGVVILVDANDVYSFQDTIDFLHGIKDVPLYWLEEPFVEERKKCKQLRQWMDSNGFEKTLYADGEREPNLKLCSELYKQGSLDVCLHDINSYGFTKWRKLMPKLIETKTVVSPHAWGSRFKTQYCAHLAAGLGNFCTIEGVTCESEDVDFGDYSIKDGKLHVSDKPGFGMKLLV
ncbi:mandelate racemase/muconate lactonizing protein [Rhodopirellula sallentina SM41]|uniref:Mandelate racemase/muconate lactonizing protein n=2 Tax=Rhodopirellula TaxID=265488 RepID=M5UM34_9BACT|nr:mandelate racemase/muconate lactonizing protein [Rhodopirellula sallentina SM41]